MSVSFPRLRCNCDRKMNEEIEEWSVAKDWELMETEKRIKALEGILSDKKQPWQHRVQALELLGCWQMDLNEVSFLLVSEVLDGIKVQLTENRSMVVKAVCESIASMARKLGSEFRDISDVLFPDVFVSLKNSKAVFRDAALACLRELIQIPDGLGIVAVSSIIEEGRTSKTPAIRHVCLDLLKSLLDRVDEQYAEMISKTIAQGVQDAKPEVREAAKELFILFAQKHPQLGQDIKLALPEKSVKFLNGELNQ